MMRRSDEVLFATFDCPNQLISIFVICLMQKTQQRSQLGLLSEFTLYSPNSIPKLMSKKQWNLSKHLAFAQIQSSLASSKTNLVLRKCKHCHSPPSPHIPRPDTYTLRNIIVIYRCQYSSYDWIWTSRFHRIALSVVVAIQLFCKTSGQPESEHL